MQYLLKILILLSVSTSAFSMCGDIVVHSKEKIEFTDTEENLVCGDPKSTSYQKVPHYQSQYYFVGFLQSRGYLNSTFEEKDGVLHVNAGRISHLKKVHADSPIDKEATAVKKNARKLFRKKVLTPKLLNDVETESLTVIRQRGYPCSSVKSEANALSDTVTIIIPQLKFERFGKLDREEIKGLHENALDRYYPFHEEDPYNEKLLKLTEKRMLRSEVVQGTYFLDNCMNQHQDFKLRQEFITGPPRSFRYGFGASTELGPMVRVQWAHNRYGSMASILKASFMASLRSQTLTLSSDQFLWKDKPRRSLLTSFNLARQSQIKFDETIVNVKPHMKWTTDNFTHQWTRTLGPTFETGTYKSRDSDTKSYKTISLEGSLQRMAHDYEIYDINPEEGNSFGIAFDYRDTNLGFSDRLLKLDTSYVTLTKITDWGRGWLVGGFRTNLGTTWVSRDVDLKGLPPSVKYYGGGSDDVRGFLLNTIPKNDGLGALTKVATKFELRRTYLFYKSVEGFMFVDNAYFGDTSWTLDPRLWYSPGLGVRWISPIGLLQTYVSRAYATNPRQDLGNFYYVGFGGVF